jgi:hypothetical protein
MDEPREPPEDPPRVQQFQRRDRPICPVHEVLMVMRKSKQEVRVYYCPEPTCRVTESIQLRTVRRFDP